jgi:hypothetical protein
MNTEELLAAISGEIARLEEVKRLFGGDVTGASPVKRGRKPGSMSPRPKKRKMSAEGRARIAAAQKARWAKAKKNA